MDTAAIGAAPRQLHALMTDYPNTRALRAGQIGSDLLGLMLEEVTVVFREFPALVRGEKYDVAELPIVTYLQAHEAGAPLVLLPYVMNGRFQHDALVHDASLPPARRLTVPQDLRGRRIGVRSYSQTTVTWVRGILAEDYGIAPEEVTWVTLDDAHVAGVADPVWCRRAPAGATLQDLLLAGRIDAAVIAPRFVTDDRIRPLIADPAAAALDWHRRTGIRPMNHMLVMRRELSRDGPDLAAEVFRMLLASKHAAPVAKNGIDLTPAGLANLRPSLEGIIDYAFRSGAIGRRPSVDELFDDTTRNLSA
ncbi:substrate-binding domain-containing protein [Paenirhodobacter populi]|uniref:phosphate ABC transporter substrate-binding protein n=1 Tax=Paenirhodobacter populi TaxID=2306993 RepID=UPI000FE2E9AB|nr:phosphate ABC transporter substrate-binding protein [Sinirhodobacter populi]RWR06886.1 phosphate ABC transporter substrate-binding protein [Sinirhodobacter populi]